MADDEAKDPGSTSRTQYRHGDLRRALITAGIELARGGGPDAVVLREATRRAGVVPNAAYRHFSSRDELLEAVRSAALAELAQAIEEGISAETAACRDASPIERAQASLRGVGVGYLRFARQNPGLFRTAFTAATSVSEKEIDPERAGPSGLSAFHLLGRALDDLASANILSAQRRAGAEYLAWSAVHGLSVLAIDGPLARLPASELESLGARLLEMVIKGL